jgi:hypothetical protein
MKKFVRNSGFQEAAKDNAPQGASKDPTDKGGRPPQACWTCKRVGHTARWCPFVANSLAVIIDEDYEGLEDEDDEEDETKNEKGLGQEATRASREEY